MSVDNLDVIDFISVNADGQVVLTISDHLSWGSKEHLHLLQEKINAYIGFIESGDIYEKYASAKDREFVIELVYRFDPLDEDLRVIGQFQSFLNDVSIKFRYFKLVIGS